MAASLTKFRLSELVFIAFTVQSTAFAKGQELGATDPESPDHSTHTAAPFASLPPEIIEKIFQKLPQADLRKVRCVNKRFSEIATNCAQEVKISRQISAEELQGFQAFLKKLKNIKLIFSRKPFKDELGLFHDLRIRALQLASGDIKANDIKELTPHLPNLQYLQELNLSNNRIGVEGARALARCLPLTLQKLNLGNSGIGDAGVKVLAEWLPLTLQELDLSWNNIVTEGAQALAERPLPNLRKLNLSWNYIRNDNAEVLAKWLPLTLQEFDLGGNYVGAEGAKALAEHLPLSLQHFCLRKNDIKDAGLETLLKVIPDTNLKKLTISLDFGSPLCREFENLRNRQNVPIAVLVDQDVLNPERDMPFCKKIPFPRRARR